MDVRPFQIHVEQRVLDDLSMRLARARRRSVVGEPGWAFGTSSAYLQDLVSHWRTSYDWRLQEAKLNELPQFLASVGGTELHFVHMRAPGRRPTPLLLLHGWPDSFYRFHKVIPKLHQARGHAVSDDGFDLIVPSLPGFAFSGGVPSANLDQSLRRSADLLWRLMTEVLGYDRFAVAGGDGGGALAQLLAIDHPETVIGIHLTDLGWHVTKTDAKSVPKSEEAYLTAMKSQYAGDGAYAMVQATRPRSLAAGLNDSPVGLASWIVDRFHAWCGSPGGDIGGSFTQDELLTNIMLYWVTQTIGSSVFSYYAEAQSPSLTPDDYVGVPVALALFPRDVGGIPPRSLAERTLNVQRWIEMPRGGHFAALEEPELYAGDVADFFRHLKASSRVASVKEAPIKESEHVSRIL